MLDQLKCLKGKTLAKDPNGVLNKYYGLKIVFKISKILKNEFDGFAENLTNDDLVFFMYAPLFSIDVEQNFLKYKNLILNGRNRFTFENMFKNV